MDQEIIEKGIFTFVRICVEIDFSKGLPNHIHLVHKDFKWTPLLDFENTAFRCWTCLQIRHLQNTCPQAKKGTKKDPKSQRGRNS